jgi:pantetheine-phosphate adenylyltransferase
MTRIAVYPGSFDPITNGHIDIVQRSLQMVDKVIVAIASNVRKTSLFTLDERRLHITTALGGDPRVEVDAFDGLLVDYLPKKGAKLILRGLRALSDFEYEFQFAHMNRRLSPGIESIFLMTSEKDFYVSSSLVKEVAQFGGDINGLVPPIVAEALRAKLGKRA